MLLHQTKRSEFTFLGIYDAQAIRLASEEEEGTGLLWLLQKSTYNGLWHIGPVGRAETLFNLARTSPIIAALLHYAIPRHRQGRRILVDWRSLYLKNSSKRSIKVCLDCCLDCFFF